MFIDNLRQLKVRLSADEYKSILPILRQFEPIFALLSINIDEKINLYFPKGKELTKDQKDLRDRTIRYYEHLASVWFAIEFNKPLPWENNQNWLENKSYNEGLELHVKEMRYLWELMQYAEPLLMKEMKMRLPEFSEHPYINILFYEIYRTQAFNEFKVCLQPYIKISNNEVIEDLKMFSKILENKEKLPNLKPHQHREIKVYEDLKKPKNHYLRFVYLACYKEAKAGDKTMQKLLDQWTNIQKDKYSYIGSLRRRRRSSKNFNRYYCECWNNGKRIRYGVFKKNKKL